MSSNRSLDRVLFSLFFFSGCCGLLYQVVWVRLAFASFGIVTPVLSVVISVFMLGLALGSWLAGLAVTRVRARGLSSVQLYGLAELGIGVGAFSVPTLFDIGSGWLRQLGEADSGAYLFASAVAIAVAILPWCVFMGATYPLMMGYLRERERGASNSFSFLYFANVMGATAGALLTATVLVELMGFRHTLWVAGGLNFAIAGVSFVLSRVAPGGFRADVAADIVADSAGRRRVPLAYTMLFTTGLISLAMEVVWTRSFTPIVGTQVYSFTALLVIYLVATFVGSHVYRRDLARGRVRSLGWLLAVLAVVAFLPVLLNDPRITHGERTRMVLMACSLFPLCALLGYLTPRLIDLECGGNPRLAGRAYAVNVLGCIIGPLLASYVMLPFLGAKMSLVLLAVPLALFAWAHRSDLSPRWRHLALPASAALAVLCAGFGVSHEDPSTWGGVKCEVRRDYAATVVSTGEGMKRRLLVNGVGITELTPITKYIAHLPLAFLEHKPRSGLVICFGMGTTYRSLLSWDIPTTAVELVPSVRDAFAYYHADAATVFANPLGHVVIDDGRRFLDRATETWDVIVVDPPPPIEAAGSSLLYSREFHEAVKSHLAPGGIFQSWWPGGEPLIECAIARSLSEVFPHVKVFGSIDGWGNHFLASMSPLTTPSAEALIQKLPEKARVDLTEWAKVGLLSDVRTVLESEIPLSRLLVDDPRVTITDDHPFNEYYLLRRRGRP